jgi:hypothetical protein
MTNKLFFGFSLLFFWVMLAFLFVPFGHTEDIKPYDTLSLSIQTGLNGTIAPWDSCVCLIVHTGNGTSSVIGRTKLAAVGYGSMIPAGIYRGQWFANGSKRGSYMREYYCWYGTDVIGDIPMPFGIIDTSLFLLSSGGGSAIGICGSGSSEITFSVLDYSDSVGIPDVVVKVMNSGGTSKVVEGTTDGNGIIKYSLDSLLNGQQYKIWLYGRPDYDFNFPESAFVRGAATFTYYGNPFPAAITTPDSATNIVFGNVYNASLEDLSGVIVTAKLYVPNGIPLTYNGYLISPYKRADTTNTAGQWTLPLIPNSYLNPDSTEYIFNFEYPKTWAGYLYSKDQDSLTVPAGDTISYKRLKGR